MPAPRGRNMNTDFKFFSPLNVSKFENVLISKVSFCLVYFE